jgi:transposase InsO family protein
MSQKSRHEYLGKVRDRYAACSSRVEKSQIIDEVVANLGYHRKYAIQVLQPGRPMRQEPVRRPRPVQYTEGLRAIRLAWEALDYPCAERLHPVLPKAAEQLAAHGELYLDNTIREQLGRTSRSTLGRRISTFPRVKITRIVRATRAQARIRNEVPTGRFDYSETRVGALEIDLVEHNGGSSSGHYAYTLNIVDVVSGFSRRKAVLGRGQAGVFEALKEIIAELPFEVWALHSDNGSEFLNGHLLRYTREHGLTFHRGRPYRKNDQPYVEQKNGNSCANSWATAVTIRLKRLVG